MKALYDLHEEKICHGDIKPQNIIWFGKDYTWKLIDLDSAARVDERRPICYTISYAAPEVLKAETSGCSHIVASAATDMWSLGIIVFEIFTGEIS